MITPSWLRYLPPMTLGETVTPPFKSIGRERRRVRHQRRAAVGSMRWAAAALGMTISTALSRPAIVEVDRQSVEY